MTKKFLIDAGERVLFTFLEAALAALLLAGAFDLDTLKAAGLAGATAALTLVKVLIASRLGDPESAGVTK